MDATTDGPERQAEPAPRFNRCGGASTPAAARPNARIFAAPPPTSNSNRCPVTRPARNPDRRAPMIASLRMNGPVEIRSLTADRRTPSQSSESNFTPITTCFLFAIRPPPPRTGYRRIPPNRACKQRSPTNPTPTPTGRLQAAHRPAQPLSATLDFPEKSAYS